MPLTSAPTTISRSSWIAVGLASVLLLGLAAGGIWSSYQVTMVPSAVPPGMAVEEQGDGASLTTDTHSRLRLSAAGPSWREISEAQRQALMPLRDRWNTMGALAKRRWLVLADRYPTMDEAERNRLVSRMTTWANLSVQQRNQARINFESVKRLSAEELQSKWDAYQALSESEKQRLAEQARKARAAKKSKRRLAQVPPPVPPAVKDDKPVKTGPLPAVITQPVATPSVVESVPVFTPQAAPAVQLTPLEQKSAKPEAPAAASQPVAVPQAAPALVLPPLHPATDPHPPATATQPPAAHPPAPAAAQ